MVTSNLPPQPTPFIGREVEINEITALLDEPNCRLLTLIGPGGIGKTRLAIEVAARKLEEFADGVYFIDLQPVSAIEYVVPTIAGAVGLPLHGGDAPHAQLARYLGDKHMLLLVDNFEHLLAGAGFLITILDTAPAIKLLVTSRETLNVQSEWLQPVHGLRFPSGGLHPDDATCDAVQLFATRAGQVRRDFSLTDDLQDVTRICQLVEGMPLALELAASWLRVLSCAQVAGEIEQSLDFLAAPMRDLPERHQSMWAVFTSTWHRLTHQEREVFKRLTVFRGGFCREAAEQVAGTSLSMLAALVNRSLLRVTPAGRYAMHELVRQYGEEQFKELPEEWEQVQDLHCKYYTKFLHQLEPVLKGPDQIDALDQIENEIDNVRVAWRRAATRRWLNEIGQALVGLALYHEMRGLRWEEINSLQLALDNSSEEPSVVLGRLLAWQGQALWHTNIIESQKLLQESIAMLRAFGVTVIPSFPLWTLGTSRNRELRATVSQLCLENLSVFRQVNDNWAIANTIITLGVISGVNETYDVAREHYQESLAIFRTIGDRLGMARSYAGLVSTAWAQAQYDEVLRHAQKWLAVSETIGDKGGIGCAQVYLGGVAYLQKDYDKAKRLFERSFQFFSEFHNEITPTGSLTLLAMVAHTQGDFPLCRRYLSEVWQATLNEARRRENKSVLLVYTARLWIAEGRKESAVELIAAVLPGWAEIEPLWRTSPTWKHMGTSPEALLAELESELPLDVFAAAKLRGETTNLETIVADVVDELAASIPESESLHETDSVRARRVDQRLIEPLTERELEVLVLIVEGYRNHEIADRLYIGVSTVKKHINHIFSKLRVDTRARAIARARELDLF